MDQVQVEVVDPEPLEAVLERAADAIAPVVGVPQLGRHEYVRALQLAAGDALGDPRFVVVRGGSVERAVPG